MRKIERDGRLLALIIEKDYSNSGLEFYTPESFGLQLGLHKGKKGSIIDAHKHKVFENIKNLEVQELLVVRKGKIKVTLMDIDEEITLDEGDLILMNTPHKIDFDDDSEFLVVKQGPYRGKDNEKEFI